MKLNKLEIEAIHCWTSSSKSCEYRNIKGVLRGDYRPYELSYDTYKKYADALIGLFEKYEDNTQDKTLYRGDVLEDTFENYLKNNPIGECIVLEDTILSFSLSEKRAIECYRNNDKYISGQTPSILYILQNKKSIFLDISAYSLLSKEKEVLCNKNIKFKVMNIEEKENNHLVYFIEECEYDN